MSQTELVTLKANLGSEVEMPVIWWLRVSSTRGSGVGVQTRVSARRGAAATTTTADADTPRRSNTAARRSYAVRYNYVL